MEAFVYCWTDKKTNKIYVGSHKGSAEDGYVCSSKYMLQEYNKRPSDFTRQIVAVGSFSDIRKLEEAILKTANAAKDMTFYNQSNGSSKFTFKFHTEKSKLSISKGKSGKKRPDLSERNKLGLSEETKQKIRKNHQDISGEKNPMYGKCHSEESKQKMSLARSGLNKNPKSEETKKKMSLARKNYWDKKRGHS